MHLVATSTVTILPLVPMFYMIAEFISVTIDACRRCKRSAV